MKSISKNLILVAAMIGALTACGSQEKEAKVSQLNLSDELVFPSKGDNLVTLEEIPDGEYAIKEIKTYTQNKGFNRVLYKLNLKKAGTPNRKEDQLEVKARWENEKLAGGFVSMAGSVPLSATMKDGILDLKAYKLLKMEASNGEKPTYSFEPTPGGPNDRGQYSVLFSDLATRNGNVYSAIGMDGSILLQKKTLSLFTVSKAKDYSIVTQFTFELAK